MKKKKKKPTKKKKKNPQNSKYKKNLSFLLLSFSLYFYLIQSPSSVDYTQIPAVRSLFSSNIQVKKKSREESDWNSNGKRRECGYPHGEIGNGIVFFIDKKKKKIIK